MLKAAPVTRMQIRRRQLDRLLDPSNTSATLRRAAQAVERKLKVELV